MSDWSDEAVDTITVPSTAGPTDPAVIIGQAAEPILANMPTPQKAGIVWQIGNGKYYVFSVDIDGVGDSRMHILCYDGNGGQIRSDVLEATLNTDNSGFIELMDGQLKLSWDSTRSVYQVESFAPLTVNDNVTLNYNLTVGGNLAVTGTTPSDVRAVFYSTAGTLCTTSTTGAETAVPSWSASSSTGATFKAGRIYAIEATFGAYDNTTEDAEFTVRVRKAVNSTGALQLAFFRPTASSVGGNVPSYGPYQEYVANKTANDIVTGQLGLTIQRAVGTGTVALFGDANIKCRLVVRDVDTVANNPALAAAATAIT